MNKILCFLLIVFLTSGCNTEPNLKEPKPFKIRNVEFAIPGNWYEGKNGKDENIGLVWTSIKSPDNFVFGIQHYNQRLEYDLEILAENYVNNLMSKMNESYFETEMIENNELVTLQIMGEDVDAILFEYQNKALGQVVDQRTYLFQLISDSSTCIFVATTNVEDWPTEQEGFDLIVRTLKMN